MPTLVISNRTSGKSSRFQIDIELADTVATLKERVSTFINMSQQDTELLYCGERLKDSCKLDSYDLQTGVSIHVLKKPEPATPVEKPEPLDHKSTHQIVAALQATLLNPAYRNTVEKMLEDPESMENIMAATPGLETDPVAIAILQDPMMLSMLADPKNIKKVIDAHPCLGQAAMLVAASVTEDATKGGASRATSRQTYSLDDLSDDEDYMPAVQGNTPGTSGGSGSATITASQLAQALASTSTSVTPQQSQSHSTPGSSSSAITSDFFQQAMSAALGGTPISSQQGEPQSSPSTSQRTSGDGAENPHTEQNMESQLMQLKDMGITDEHVARQALQATGGNLQAALEILFGDTTN